MQHPSSNQTAIQTFGELTNDQKAVLRGVPVTSWAAHELLKWPLVMGEVGKNLQRIPELLLYPTPGADLPTPVRLMVVDLGKRAYKFVCLDAQSRYVTSVIPDAYAPVTGMMEQEGENFGGASDGEDSILYAYVVHESGVKEGIEFSQEAFEMGSNKDALRRADILPTDEDSKVRIRDPRSRNMIFAGLAEQYAKLGVSPESEQQVILCIGVPPRDLEDERIAETNAAAATLKGKVQIEQRNLRTGQTVTWTINIVGLYVEVQTKGTFYAVAKTLNGDNSLLQKLFKIYDVGGGDTNIVEVDASGAIMAKGERKGYGTVEIARALQKKIEGRYGMEVSEIAAQEALYTRKIWRGGIEQDISPLVDELKPRKAQILTRITVSRESLSTFIVFTGGGSALLEAEIIDMMKNKNEKLVLGEDFIIIPSELAPLCNAIGLYALAFFKISTLVKRTIIQYLEIGDQLEAAQKELESVQQLDPRAVLPAERQKRENTAAGRVRKLHEQYTAHVGRGYPTVQVKAINAQRKAAAAAAARQQGKK